MQLIRQWLKKRLPHGSFARGLLLLTGGTAFGHLVLIASSPLLTRLYDAADFGVFAIFSSMTSILAMIMAGRYEFAVPVCRTDEDGANLTLMALLIVLCMGCLLFLPVWFFNDWLAEKTATPELRNLLWLLPPAAICIGLSLVLSFWSVRRGSFGINSVNKIVLSTTQAGSQLLLGFGKFGGSGLIIGHIFGFLVQFIHFASKVGHRDFRFWQHINLTRMVALAIEYKRYPIYLGPSTLLNACSNQLPALGLAILFGPAAAGWFSLALRAIGMPVTMISQSANQVYLGALPKLNIDEARALFVKTVVRFFGLGIIGIMPVVLFGPWLFEMIFGAGWREAGEMAQIMVFLFAIRFTVTPVSQTLNIFQRQDLHLVFAGFNFTAMIASFSIMWLLDLGMKNGIYLYTFLGIVAQLSYLVFSWHVLNTHDMPENKELMEE